MAQKCENDLKTYQNHIRITSKPRQNRIKPYQNHIKITEGSLEVKLPTYGHMEKQRREEAEKSKEEERRSEKRRNQKKEDAGAREGGKVAKHYAFSDVLRFRRVKSRHAKAAGAEPPRKMRDEKLHAVVAQSTFRSQNAKNTAGSGHL